MLIPTKVSTKFISFVTKSVTCELTNRLCDVVKGVDIKDDVVPVATFTIEPVRFTSPNALDPVPVKLN